MAAGSIIIDLLMRTGSFETDTARAAKAAQRRAKEIDTALSGAARRIGTAFAALGAGLSIGGLMQSFVRNTIDAQNEQAQLAAVLQSTGEAAGFSAEKLNAMAAEMAGRSIFSEGDITNAQTRLLSYTGIVGDVFPAAMQAAADMATRLGMTFEQSAETIGKALDVPSQGLAALSKQGFRFTEEQKKAVEQLERTGQVAQAQAIVLTALESSYGGAAQAARDTFGGATAALRNELSSLMTGEGGSLEGARQAVEDLTSVLRSDETKSAFAAMIGGLASILEWTVKAAAGVLNFGRFLGEFLGRAVHGAADPIERLDDQIIALEGNIRLLNDGLSRTSPDSAAYREMGAEVSALSRELVAAKKARDDLVRSANNPGAPAASSGTPSLVGPSAAQTAALARQRELSAQASKAGEQATKQAEQYLKSLQAQLQATKDLSVLETVRADLADKRFGNVSAGTRAEIEGIAQQIDNARKLAAEYEEQNRQLTAFNAAVGENAAAARSLIQSVETPLEALNRKLKELGELAESNPFVPEQTMDRLRDQVWSEYDSAAIRDAGVQIDDFAKQARENVQDIFGDALYDAADGNFKDILGSFADMIRRMVAQAAAANLTRALFGAEGKNDGWLGTAASAFGSWLGGGTSSSGGMVGPRQLDGSFAGGGNAQGGGAYLVGERGPEIFLPTTSGRVLSNDESFGGGQPRVQVNNYYGSELQTSVRQGSDGRTIIDLERRMLSAVAADTAAGGVTARATAQRLGGNNGAGLSRRRG